MKSKSGKKSRFLYPACQNRALVARKTGFCSLQSAEKSSFWQETPIPVGFQESGKGFALQKCRFLAKRRSANAFLDRLRRSEERNAAAFIPPLSNGTEERGKASPFAARFTPTRAATPWRVSPSPRLRLAFTPPTPSATPTPSPCLYLPPCPHSQAGVPPACTRQFSAYDKMTIA